MCPSTTAGSGPWGLQARQPRWAKRPRSHLLAPAVPHFLTPLHNCRPANVVIYIELALPLGLEGAGLNYSMDINTQLKRWRRQGNGNREVGWGLTYVLLECPACEPAPVWARSCEPPLLPARAKARHVSPTRVSSVMWARRAVRVLSMPRDAVACIGI